MQPIINYFTNIPRNKLIIRFIIVLFVLIIITVSSFFAWDYFVNQKVVTLNPSAGTTITIGEQARDEMAIGKQIASTNSLKSIRLQSGVYIVIFTGTSDYQDEYQSISIDKSTEIKTPDLKYTDEKLGRLLVSEKPAIQNVITPILPNPGYQIDNESLYEIGNWYGARLIPGGWYLSPPSSNILPGLINDNNTEDMLRVILKNDNGQWKLMAGPSIIFAIDDYPDIPEDVIRTTNKLGFN